MRDPRRHRRYTETRALWLAGYGGGLGACILCGQPVDTTLPGLHPHGPTIEHRLPIRVIRATASDWAECLAMACDTSTWALAHKRCQDRQGQRATATANRRRNNLRAGAAQTGQSRVW